MIATLVSPVGFVAVFVAIVVLYLLTQKKVRKGPNPFTEDARKPPAPFIYDHHEREKSMKVQYKKSLVPEGLDAIVIGSGIGGMTAAALLAKTGKKVLVLEQHDVAGGCCHMFRDHGFEFDTGIHYIGEMLNNTTVKFLLDQISNGQVTWTPLEKVYDQVALGNPKDKTLRKYDISAGREEFPATLKAAFPDEAAAIDKYMALLEESRKGMLGFVAFKFLPTWLTSLLSVTGLAGVFFNYFNVSKRTLQSVLDDLTTNADLKATLAYCFGDYGTVPSETSFAMHAALISHFLYGVAYPVGGAAEIPRAIIPTIEKAGGKVLVRARVKSILVDTVSNMVTGVELNNGDQISCPLVLSDAGWFNTVESLLPKEVVATNPTLKSPFKAGARHGMASMSVYIGLRGSAADNGLKAQNMWAFFDGNDIDGASLRYLDRDPQEVIDNADINVPLMFVSFPSTKDPTWDARFPDKSTCEIITFAKWEWFEKWKDAQVTKRGVEYDQLKTGLGKKLWDQVVALFPNLDDKVEYFNVGSPLTNNYYIASPRGEIYGLDHNAARFSPAAVSAMRPDTSVHGLYLSGQDVFSCGFVGAMFGGLLCASKVLERNLYEDLVKAKSRFAKKKTD